MHNSSEVILPFMLVRGSFPLRTEARMTETSAGGPRHFTVTLHPSGAGFLRLGGASSLREEIECLLGRGRVEPRCFWHLTLCGHNARPAGPVPED